MLVVDGWESVAWWVSSPLVAKNKADRRECYLIDRSDGRDGDLLSNLRRLICILLVNIRNWKYSKAFTL